MRTLKRTCPKVYGELSEDKINKLSKCGVKIEAHTDSEPSEHGEDAESDEGKGETQRTEQEGDSNLNDLEAEWNRAHGGVRDEDVADLKFEDLTPEDEEMLRHDPLNLVMLEDNQQTIKRARNEDILRNLGFDDNEIR